MCSEDEVMVECRKVEEMCKEGMCQQALDHLKEMIRRTPTRSEPHMYLAQLYRTLARRGATLAARENFARCAVEHAMAAAKGAPAPTIEVLRAVRGVMHAVAAHRECAEVFSDVGKTHPKHEARFISLCWASIACECLGKELLADGRIAESTTCNERAVYLHRLALEVLPSSLDAAGAALDSYFGESHIVRAYVDAGQGDKWIEEVVALLDGLAPEEVPAKRQAFYLCQASDVAADLGRGDLAMQLAERARDKMSTLPEDRTEHVRLLGALLRSAFLLGDSSRREATAGALLAYIGEWSSSAAVDDVLPDRQVGGAYNIAARYFLQVCDWERAIVAAERGVERWNYGPSHFFLATALLAGRNDREGALEALRCAARDVAISGKGGCRNLWIDFHNEAVFAKVRDDPEFLAAIRVPWSGDHTE